MLPSGMPTRARSQRWLNTRELLRGMNAESAPMNAPAGKYSIELCKSDGFTAGIDGVIARDDDLARARTLYRAAARVNPDRVVLLCDRARVLARSDRPETMP
jgi:hypothetical protein